MTLKAEDWFCKFKIFMVSSLKRILKFGWQGFWRSKGLNAGVVFVMTIAIFAFTSIFLLNNAGKYLISQIENKVDVAVYFNTDASESKILSLKSNLEKAFAGQIKKITYISKEQASINFKEKHKNDLYYQEALNELDYNPLPASLNINASDPNVYPQIANFLNQDKFKNIIKKVSYSYNENKKLINNISYFIKKIKLFGLIFALILCILVILIAYNTLRLAIFSSKNEISTMKLVGASNWFIQGPFLVQSLISVLLSILFADLIFLGVFLFSNQQMSDWLMGFNFLTNFQNNWLLILLIQFGSGIALGLISTYLAVRKFLKA